MQTDLIAAVKAHARANYNSGWDIVIECWNDAEIAERIAGAATAAAAIDMIRPTVEVIEERQAEHRAEARAGGKDDLAEAVEAVKGWTGRTALLDALLDIETEIEVEAEPDIPESIIRAYRLVMRRMRPLFVAPDDSFGDSPALDAPWWEYR